MKGSQGIKALSLVTLNKLVQKLALPPNLFFSSIFPTVQYPSDSIKWDIEYTSGGMTPFVAPGSIAPTVGLDGISEKSAAAAYWKEKMYFDEVLLNNLRRPGTDREYMNAERLLARGMRKLKYRSQRRREWLSCKMLTDGSVSYQKKGGVKFTVNYNIPSAHQVSLAASRYWGSGTSRNPVEDIFDAKITLSDDAGVVPNYAIMNSTTLKLLLFDASIQTLLSKSNYGDGDLFARPAQVLGDILGVGTLIIYDERFEVTGWLTAAVTGDSTTVITVDDASDFEAGGTARFVDMSEHNTYEDETISSVDVANNQITVATAPTRSFKAGEDKVILRKKFIPDNKFVLFASNAEGENVAEFMEAPYGNDRRWGYYADTKDEWDPEGVWIRVQDKGLPVLYYPETIYTLTVSG